jgi:aminodeoxychorismate synthase component I
LALLSAAPQTDCGFPVGGLFGNVDYEGQYRFGLYDQTLVYLHHTGEWFECGQLSHQFRPPPPTPPALRLDFTPEITPEAYQDTVQRIRHYIAAGDIYQVNLAYRYLAQQTVLDAFAAYMQLRGRTPAPQAAFIRQDQRQLLSASPELFLLASGSSLTTRPIKGTRPRHAEMAADQKSALDLLASEKERAELLMITDLERNDLGRVCQYGSVQVPDLLRLEPFSHVFHLVSTVQGTLRPECDHLDALQALSPGGSITGAPKKRACEIISELEKSPRGAYTGAIGYLGSNGESQFSIAIRTLVLEVGKAHFHVGAGIVTDSDPALEWQETLHKARSIIEAF